MILRPAAIAVGLAVATIAPVAFAEGMPSFLRVQSTSIAEPVARLSETMMMSQIIDVMRDEGLAYGKTLEEEMFPGRGGVRWQVLVEQIYDPARMRLDFDTALARELARSADATPSIEAFFASDLGQNVLKLEIQARRALLDPAVEDAAKVSWEEMLAEGNPRVTLLQDFAQANDLIESNVMGALNSNLAFYRGMAATGAFPDEMTEDQMLSDVWSQEADVRAETEDWLFPFLALAYQPLSDEDLKDYIAFSETAPGKTINAALFVAFDDVFTAISMSLGEAVARQMQGEDI